MRTPFITARTFVVLFLLANTLSCSHYREGEPIITLYAEVKDPSRDTIMAMANEKLSTEAIVTFQETLSDTAIVKFSGDTLFSQKGAGFLLPMTSSNLMSVGGLEGDSLFIKYQPIKKAISGNLKIGVTFR